MSGQGAGSSISDFGAGEAAAAIKAGLALLKLGQRTLSRICFYGRFGQSGCAGPGMLLLAALGSVQWYASLPDGARTARLAQRAQRLIYMSPARYTAVFRRRWSCIGYYVPT